MESRLILFGIVLLPLSVTSAKEIRGIVMNSDSIPIEFANVTAFANDSVVGGGTTDSSGKFTINVSDGCDRLRVSYLGYNDKNISPVANDLGKITLTHNAVSLKEIVVKAPLIRRETDRIIVNVSANPLSANKDAQELLKTAPGVWATDNYLSIYGQGGTTVYIDDRKVNMRGARLMAYLKSIQSSSIASIEIIPKAGAEYSASSTGGIIKINLKRNRVDGINGSAGLNASAGEYSQWINPFVNLSLHRGKWTFNLNGSFTATPNAKSRTYEEVVNAALGTEMKGLSHKKNRSINGNLSMGAFYDISKRDRIWLQLDYTPEKSRNNSESKTEIFDAGHIGVSEGAFNTKDRFHSFNANFNWSHILDKKGSSLKLVSNYNFQKSSVDQNNRMSGYELFRDSIYFSGNVNRYNVFVTDFSWIKVLKPNWKLNIGAKYTFNDVAYISTHRHLVGSIWINDAGQDYDTSYNENIVALYATFNGKVGRFGFKAGLRGEYFNTKGEWNHNSRFDLFPNANISLDITPKGDYTVSFGYSRKIKQPSFWSLNPVVRQFNDFTYSVGNPDLKASFTDALSLDFLLAGRYTVAIGYSETSRPIRQMYVSNPEYPERMYLTWGNDGKDRNIFIHTDGFLNIRKWWNVYASATYVVMSQKLSADVPFDTFGYLQLIASTSFSLPKGFALSVNCFYNSRMKIGNITVYPLLNLTPTLLKRFGKHWTASISVENMLQRYNKTGASTSAYRRDTKTKEYATFKIGVTYKFNSGKRFRTPKMENKIDKSRLGKD